MTPLPVNPRVVVLIAPDGSPLRVASNIAPLPEMEVQVFTNECLFQEASLGKPFVQDTPAFAEFVKKNLA